MRSPSSVGLADLLPAAVLAIAAGGAIAFVPGNPTPMPRTPAATMAEIAVVANDATTSAARTSAADGGLLATGPGGRAERPSASTSAASVCHPPWSAPVDAPVTDPFRPPDRRYGPGNRGIEYGTEPGQHVVAVADGVVEFAGPVAGRPVIVIDHGAGLRSSYVNLLEGFVGRGLVVGRGQRIAAADTAFHLGARRERRYVDPADLIERRCLVVRLVAT